MNALPVLCVLSPMVTAALTFLWPGGHRAKGLVGVAGMALLLVLAALLLGEVTRDGLAVVHLGGWPAPMGIAFVADAFGATLVLVASIVGLAVAVHALDDIPEASVAGGFHSFVHLLMAGVVGAFLTGDVFNLYVWFEVMLISSFALMVIGGDARRLDGAVKYVAINLVSTVILLVSIGLLHGLAGTLDMADLAVKLPLVEERGLLRTVSVMFLIAFGIKAAVFPLFFWLPASYHTLPITVSALFAALMTKVGVYALMRAFTLLFTADEALVRGIVLAVALLTMASGVLGAIRHTDLRRILAWQVIASIGFMLLGLGLGSPLAMAASIFYMVHGILVKALLFMLIGRVARLGGSFELSRLGGLYAARPAFSMLFLLAALSLVGIPPLSGFWAKLALVDAGLDEGAAWTLAVLLLASLATFVPIVRIWSEAFWKSAPERSADAATVGEATVRAGGVFPEAGTSAAADRSPGAARGGAVPEHAEASGPARLAASDIALIPIAALSLLLLAIGLAPAPLLALADAAAGGLLAPDAYVDAVLGAPVDEPGAEP